MKIIDIANKIDKSKRNEDWIDLSIFDYELDIQFNNYDVTQERLKCYWIGNWYCTDSWVGYRMYFLDNEPVAVSTQTGRKCNEEFEWFSKDSALKTREYLISLMTKDNDELNITLCDLNEELGEGYKIQFNGQIIMSYNRPMLNGEPIKILERIREKPDYGIGRELKIKLSNGGEKIVNIRELDFGFYINE